MKHGYKHNTRIQHDMDTTTQQTLKNWDKGHGDISISPLLMCLSI